MTTTTTLETVLDKNDVSLLEKRLRTNADHWELLKDAIKEDKPHQLTYCAQCMCYELLKDALEAFCIRKDKRIGQFNQTKKTKIPAQALVESVDAASIITETLMNALTELTAQIADEMIKEAADNRYYDTDLNDVKPEITLEKTPDGEMNIITKLCVTSILHNA